MKKIIALIILSSFLSGCLYQTVSRSDIEAGVTLCAQRQSTLVEITAGALGEEWILCSNRKSYQINSENMNPAMAM